MKEWPDSSFAHLLFVQAAVSAKNYLQASSERRGGRVKDELTLRTCQQGDAVRRMGVSFLDDSDLFYLRYHTLLLMVPTSKAKTLDFKNIPCCYVVFLFFFVVLFQNVRPCVETRPALYFWAENCFILCLPSWTHFTQSHFPGSIWQFCWRTWNFSCTF